MSVSFLGPVIAAVVTALGVYYLFRILVTSDAGQLNSSGRPQSSVNELGSAQGKAS